MVSTKGLDWIKRFGRGGGHGPLSVQQETAQSIVQRAQKDLIGQSGSEEGGGHSARKRGRAQHAVEVQYIGNRKE